MTHPGTPGRNGRPAPAGRHAGPRRPDAALGDPERKPERRPEIIGERNGMTGKRITISSTSPLLGQMNDALTETGRVRASCERTAAASGDDSPAALAAETLQEVTRGLECLIKTLEPDVPGIPGDCGQGPDIPREPGGRTRRGHGVGVRPERRADRESARPPAGPVEPQPHRHGVGVPGIRTRPAGPGDTRRRHRRRLIRGSCGTSASSRT